MASIITRGAIVQSVGVNRLKTHPLIEKSYGAHCISIHAELDALLRNKGYSDSATLYVARDGGRESKPCSVCMEYIRTARIKYIVYSTKQGLVKERV
jgi:deoxycytidylate deaminase